MDILPKGHEDIWDDELGDNPPVADLRHNWRNFIDRWIAYGKAEGYLYVYFVANGEYVHACYVKPGDNHGKIEQWCHIGGHILGQRFLNDEYETVMGEYCPEGLTT